MKTWTWIGAAALLAALIPGISLISHAGEAGVLSHTVKNIDGKDVKLDQFTGQVLLIVNTASKCGFTPQYEGLEKVYRTYKDQGFTVLAFPANNFGGQEPGSNEEIRTFCTTKYDVTFPVFGKISVKGEDIAPLYKTLTSKESDPEFAGDIQWNFTKFLIGRDGKVRARFDSKTKPEAIQVSAAIEAALAQKVE